MTDAVYVASDSPEDLEARRLRALEAMDDPATRGLLDRVGLQPGWRCLEIGAGRGSIAGWMADRVGAGGRVVAGDLDLRFLKALAHSNLEVRSLDITTDELEVDSFDLVHCRALLMHLRSPSDALRKTVSAMRPGGWLVVEGEAVELRRGD
jgi:2-polyprenyl-3-methyl-5-hydroxy-6-metoxy-1,4-benzoquinol methylase